MKLKKKNWKCEKATQIRILFLSHTDITCMHVYGIWASGHSQSTFVAVHLLRLCSPKCNALIRSRRACRSAVRRIYLILS